MNKKIYHRRQMDLSERIAIEAGINRKDSFEKIAKLLMRHKTTIIHEVRTNATYMRGYYYLGKDCRFARRCNEHQVCGDLECEDNCFRCRKYDCRTCCEKYVSMKCKMLNEPPYVCNRCSQLKKCRKDRYIYSARYADAMSLRRHSTSRTGIHLNDEQLRKLDSIVTELVNKGQPLVHIYAEHKDEIPVSLRTLYTYIDSGELTIKNADLRRKTGYRRRKKAYKPTGFENMEFRQTRTYSDYESALNKKFNINDVVEMDTIKGVREKGKRLLTLLFRSNNVMLLFLLPDATAASVKNVFDYLEESLGLETFRSIFPVILTDNGSEFKRVNDLEFNDDCIKRTTVYYCDPMASWQKGSIEKNHEFIRYVIPKGVTLNQYDDEDITLLMNHINSVKRPSLGNKSPYELMEADDRYSDLMSLLKMHTIPADDVHLNPDLLK